MVAPRALDEFISEATEILDGLARALYVLDQQRGQEPDPDRLNAVFRAAHSLKGLAAMFGAERISRLAHRAEDALDALRLGRVSLDDRMVDALIECQDMLQAMLGRLARGTTAPDLEVGADHLQDRLALLAEGSAEVGDDVLDQVGLDPQLRAVFTEYEEHRLRENVRKGVGLWKVRAVYGLDDFDSRLAALNAHLKPMGEVISTLPSSQPGDEASIAFDLVFGSGKPKETIEAALDGATLSPLTQRPHPSAPHPTPAPEMEMPEFEEASGSGLVPIPEVLAGGAGARLASDTSLRSLTQTVRVDIGRLDGLMNSIGELLLIRGNINRLADAARQVGTGAALPKLWGQELQREARALERKLDELQKGVLDVRMVPLGQVFDKLTRLMRRLVRESGKDVDFEVSGGDVELDKLIVEELSDPLMHLLRNSLDHGIEAPEVRRLHHKAQRGVIRLKARQLGNQVQIDVGDDGGGMDESRIREVAVRRGLATEEQTHEFSRRELLNLVFLPGFSTREDVSELSGRGVGLDVVKTNLARLSGLIDIDSRRGDGTTITLTLPLTLAIIRALLVSVSGRTYAVPLSAVTEIVSVRHAELKTIERREVFEVRGQTLPFVRLGRVFRLPEAPRDRSFVVVVGLAQQRLGLAVDELLGQEDIVTKPLGGRLRAIPGVSGATELGDRRAVLVLDVGALMEELTRSQTAVG